MDAKTGTIDLSGLFGAIAQRLAVSVDQGRLLHRTKNIRDAGLPLEVEFRAFLNARLPTPFSVASGYLFDPRSRCTPQIDAIVVDGQESHELMRSDDGASYVPYPSGRVLIEIKNSVVGIAKHVSQTRAVGKAVEEMRADARSLRAGGPIEFRPLTILILGETKGAKLSQFKKAFTEESSDPALTLLLDRGLIIARRGALDSFFSDASRGREAAPVLNFIQAQSRGQWAIWQPEEAEQRSGRALLWLYYAIVAQLNLAVRGNNGTILDFVSQVGRDFPMTLKSALTEAKGW